jgi:mono/diheme cytochrome c family protein
MFKPALLLLCATLLPAKLLAESISFSPTAGNPEEWKAELPTRYLLSFDVRSGAKGTAKITHGGQVLFGQQGTDGWRKAVIAVDTEAGIFSSWVDGKVVEVEKPLAAPGKPGGFWQSTADEARDTYDLGGDFTIATKFRSEGDGTLVAKCAPEGKWKAGDKALFIKGGKLVYDIGFVGAMGTKGKVADGKWHHAVLVCGGGKARLFVDGKLAAEKAKFAAKDPGGSVLKIGAAKEDFGGSLKGEIGFVRYWNRELPKEEIAALGKGDEAKTNTPQLNWKPAAKAANALLAFSSEGAKVEFATVDVGPLAEVDHARLIRSWDEKSLERGARIYTGLCITCHGDQKIEGSLPTATRFHSGEFKNGKDPLSMYNTLTHGYNQMVAQPWMTPTQKYDVIHYIRETQLKADNPKQFVPVDDTYLAGLPRGIGVGPTKATMFGDNQLPKNQKMNFGPVLFWTLEAEPGNIAYKGIAVRLDEGPGGISKGHKWLLYDHDTMRVAAAWTGDKFVNWKGIAFDQSHGTHTSIVGDVAFTNPVGPGWGRPGDGSFEEVRFRGRDDKPYGPLPREWAHYEGLYMHGNRAVLNYTVGDAVIHELPGYEMFGTQTVFTRTLEIGKSSSDLKLRIAPSETAVAALGGGKLVQDAEGFHVLEIPFSSTPLSVKILTADTDDRETFAKFAETSGAPIDLSALMAGGEKRWPDVITTEGKMGGDEKPFEVDEIALPGDERSPWNSWMRLGGFDFFEDGKRAAVATWLGDVWIVDGLGGDFGQHNWQRIATGLFQPLGVKIVNGTIYLSCRDQIAELHDKNGDGEIDYIRNFNNDHQVTEHFHEFAMGLQTDAEGNFYYAKSARHGKPALIPHHGTLIKVSADGSKTEIIATGFRAANGVCLNPDGSFIVTDQEGHWNPKNRINWVKKGGFYGNMYGYHDVTDESDDAMEQPLCWITNKFDRSPGELMWVPEEAKWGGINGSLLNLSYGMGRVFLVPHEKLADGQVQGGVISLGLDFPTGTMRGRFHPGDGQLYTTGMFAWAGNKNQDGGFYRIRYTGKPTYLPIGLKAKKGGMILEFTDKLDAESAATAANYQVKAWGLTRTKNYGSPHVDEHPLKVAGARLLEDGKSVFIDLPDIAPTWCMEIEYKLKGADGTEFTGTLDNTVHELGQ